MKRKNYKKPQIIIEDFSLITNIAGDCEGIVGNPSKYTCAVEATGGIKIFSSDLDGLCEFTSTNSGGLFDEWDQFCYHVPTEYNNLFNS